MTVFRTALAIGVMISLAIFALAPAHAVFGPPRTIGSNIACQPYTEGLADAQKHYDSLVLRDDHEVIDAAPDKDDPRYLLSLRTLWTSAEHGTYEMHFIWEQEGVCWTGKKVSLL